MLAVDSPKRSKSVKAESQKQATRLESVLNPPANTQELVRTNGINGDSTEVNGEKKNSNVVVSIDPEVLKKRKKENKKKQKEKKRLQSAQIAASSKEDSPIVWKLSEAIAGRMIDADPVFTKDEKYESKHRAYSPKDCRANLLDFSFLQIVQPSTYIQPWIPF